MPGRLGLALAAGAWAWLIGMAPALVRPHGPERRATAHALTAAAAYAATDGVGDHHVRTRAAAAAAVHTAWQTLLSARPTQTRRALERLVVRAEIALAAPADTDPTRLRGWARRLRGTGPVLHPGDLVDDDELLGVDAEVAAAAPPPWLRLGALAPIATRTALGCAFAGYVSLALGVGRPTGPWSPPRPCTRRTSRSPGGARSSASSATWSASSPSPRWSR